MLSVTAVIVTGLLVVAFGSAFLAYCLMSIGAREDRAHERAMLAQPLRDRALRVVGDVDRAWTPREDDPEASL